MVSSNHDFLNEIHFHLVLMHNIVQNLSHISATKFFLKEECWLVMLSAHDKKVLFAWIFHFILLLSYYYTIPNSWFSLSRLHSKVRTKLLHDVGRDIQNVTFSLGIVRMVFLVLIFQGVFSCMYRWWYTYSYFFRQNGTH